MLNFKGAQKLSKNELKNLTGGTGPGAQCPILCFYDEQSGHGCGFGKECVPYSCGPSRLGYRCEVILIDP